MGYKEAMVVKHPQITVIAVGTWLYDGTVALPIELLATPAAHAGSRWIEDDTGNFVLDEEAPIPATMDGFVYSLSHGSGEFLTPAEAIAWADRQSWGPVDWTFVPIP